MNPLNCQGQRASRCIVCRQLYNKLDRTDEGIYLKAFTGDRCKVDRQSRESVLVESPCLSALWLTQPYKLESLLAERSLSDGGHFHGFSFVIRVTIRTRPNLQARANRRAENSEDAAPGK